MDEVQLRKFQPGRHIQFPAFVSTSKDPIQARNFQKQDPESESQKPTKTSVRLVITIDASTSPKRMVLSISEMSALATEKEVLFFPFHEFRVDRVEHKDPNQGEGQADIFLTLVGFDPKQSEARANSRCVIL